MLSQAKSEISSSLSQLSSGNVINRENEMPLNSKSLTCKTSSMKISLMSVSSAWNQTLSVLTQRISLLEAVNPSCESRIFSSSCFLPLFSCSFFLLLSHNISSSLFFLPPVRDDNNVIVLLEGGQHQAILSTQVSSSRRQQANMPFPPLTLSQRASSPVVVLK